MCVLVYTVSVTLSASVKSQARLNKDLSGPFCLRIGKFEILVF